MTGQTLQQASVALLNGSEAVYNSSGLLVYRHSDHLGSSRFASTPSRTKYYDVAYAPYGEDYVNSGTTDLSFTGQKKGTASWLYDFMFRKYNPVHGRWMSPDPSGMAATNPANPQSWNRYAYVANNPLSAIDPLRLLDEPTCKTSVAIGCGGMDNGGQGVWAGAGGYGGAVAGGAGVEACGVDSYCVQKGGIGPFGSPVAQWHCGTDGHCMTGSSVFSQYIVGGTYQVDWQAQRQAVIDAAIKKINGAFSLIAANLGLDPNQQIPVRVQYSYGVWNVRLQCDAGTGCAVDQNTANATGWPDPITFMHQGDPSWYFGSLFGFNAGHLIGSDPAGAHIDPFGPFNPLHYVIQMPAMLFPAGPVGYTSCSINGGCN
jgi:RHS repeat-associated protein